MKRSSEFLSDLLRLSLLLVRVSTGRGDLSSVQTKSRTSKVRDYHSLALHTVVLLARVSDDSLRKRAMDVVARSRPVRKSGFLPATRLVTCSDRECRRG